MYILGVSLYHADSSACLVKDGRLVAAVEEERFTRVKHWAGIPAESIRYCLQAGGIDIQDVEHVCISRNPRAHIYNKIKYAFYDTPSLSLIKNRLRYMMKTKNIRDELCDVLGLDRKRLRAEFHMVEHHKAHMGSSFFVSPFDEAAILSIDGFGDFVSTMWGKGEGGTMKVYDWVSFPHSLGYLYAGATQFLGFPKYGDEYKVMGLSSYGEPDCSDAFNKIINLRNGSFDSDLSYFNYYAKGTDISWEEGGEPVREQIYTDKWTELFGPPRKPGTEMQQKHKNMASSLQAFTEEAYFYLLNNLYKETKLKNLCLAGGVALNSVANGKVFDSTPFEEVYIQPAAGDAGTAIGAAYYVYHQILNQPRDFTMVHSYWGPEFSNEDIGKELETKNGALRERGCEVQEIPDETALCKQTAEHIADGKVVGWFQGRMEWGPRALGNRSILVDPRRAEMKDLLNERVKRRESFRPFAPSILAESVGEYFTKAYPDPFMLKVYPVKPEKRASIPAVTHVDGTGRLQTVSWDNNPLYWTLINEFAKITGTPLILNTSFNENEPIVCTPQEATECFLRTKMDVLVLGNYIVRQKAATRKDA